MFLKLQLQACEIFYLVSIITQSLWLKLFSCRLFWHARTKTIIRMNGCYKVTYWCWYTMVVLVTAFFLQLMHIVTLT